MVCPELFGSRNRSLVREGPGGAAHLDADFIFALIQGGSAHRGRSLASLQGIGLRQVPAALEASDETVSDSRGSSEDESLPVAMGGPNDLFPADPQQYLQVSWARSAQIPAIFPVQSVWCDQGL